MGLVGEPDAEAQSPEGSQNLDSLQLAFRETRGQPGSVGVCPKSPSSTEALGGNANSQIRISPKVQDEAQQLGI